MCCSPDSSLHLSFPFSSASLFLLSLLFSSFTNCATESSVWLPRFLHTQFNFSLLFSFVLFNFHTMSHFIHTFSNILLLVTYFLRHSAWTVSLFIYLSILILPFFQFLLSSHLIVFDSLFQDLFLVFRGFWFHVRRNKHLVYFFLVKL